jgi:Raf kinase inhibitor-like YbhB/YbcL family protein
MMAMQLSCSAFPAEASIPRTYTCDGENRSPPLSWSDAPVQTLTFALIAEDRDAPHGTFTHWVLFDIPAVQSHLPEGILHRGDMSEGTRQGRNGFGGVGYGGPCPPSGKPHRYVFNLYALDDRLNLEPGSSKAEVERAMQGHVLEQTQFAAHYQHP